MITNENFGTKDVIDPLEVIILFAINTMNDDIVPSYNGNIDWLRYNNQFPVTWNAKNNKKSDSKQCCVEPKDWENTNYNAKDDNNNNNGDNKNNNGNDHNENKKDDEEDHHHTHNNNNEEIILNHHPNGQINKEDYMQE